MKLTDNRREILSIVVLTALFLICSILFFKIMKIFLIPLLLALTFTILFMPVYKKIRNQLKGRKNLSSLLICLLIILSILVPAYLVSHLVVLQASDFYSRTEKLITSGELNENHYFLKKIKNLPLAEQLLKNQENLLTLAKDLLKTGSRFLSAMINRLSSGIAEIVIMLFLTFYTMFYFFRDGEQFVKKIRYLSPLKEKYENRLISRFSTMAKATVKGTLVIGLLQGAAGTITFALFSIKGWALWGVIMTLLSVIPVVGSFLVMLPAAAYKLAVGEPMSALIIVFVALVVNYAIDYLLRPVLVGQQSRIHDLLIFFTTMGGLAVFGLSGVIIGPLIGMMFMTLLDIYSSEFHDYLK
ncbi:MAG TPA: AI-2E family transporter [Spirochaetota bacterium]|nr:AI-2E family transporter [Spirochaetota bacterium]